MHPKSKTVEERERESGCVERIYTRTLVFFFAEVAFPVRFLVVVVVTVILFTVTVVSVFFFPPP